VIVMDGGNDAMGSGIEDGGVVVVIQIMMLPVDC